MKLKNLFFVFCLALLVSTCNSSDDATDPDKALFPTDDPIAFTTESSVDVEAVLALPVGSDISNLINLGQPEGESAAEFLSTVRLDDVVIFNQPDGLQSSDTFFYRLDFNVFDSEGNPLSIEDQQEIYGALVIGVENIDDIVGGENIILEFAPEDIAPILSQIGLAAFVDLENEDLNFKYDMTVYIQREDDIFGPYIIDPKIKIKSRSFSN